MLARDDRQQKDRRIFADDRNMLCGRQEGREAENLHRNPPKERRMAAPAAQRGGFCPGEGPGREGARHIMDILSFMKEQLQNKPEVRLLAVRNKKFLQ